MRLDLELELGVDLGVDLGVHQVAREAPKWPRLTHLTLLTQ